MLLHYTQNNKTIKPLSRIFFVKSILLYGIYLKFFVKDLSIPSDKGFIEIGRAHV